MGAFTWVHSHGDTANGNGKRKSRQFSLSVYCSLSVQTEVCRLPFVDEETNGSYPFAFGLNGLNRLNGRNIAINGFYPFEENSLD